jgi:hypothetical protein
MSDWLINLLKSTIFGTVVSGVIVFVLSQLFIEYVIKPIQKGKALRAKVAYCLTYYGNTYTNPINNTFSGYKQEWWDEASTELRKIAAELEAFSIEKPLISFFLPRKINLMSAKSYMIGLSNSMINPNPDVSYYKSVKEEENLIRKLLKLDQ